MLASIDAKELKEWEVYWELEPFGPQIDNLNFGTLASLLYNINRRKGYPAISPAEMALGDFEVPKKKQTGSEMIAMFKNIVSKMKKKKVKKNG